MFSKMFKPLTLSFLLTAMCVMVALWVTSTGFAVNNKKCENGIKPGTTEYCNRFKTASSCDEGYHVVTRSGGYNCVGSHPGWNCEIYQKEKCKEKSEKPCEWNNTSNTCERSSTSPTHSGADINSCNDHAPSSS